MAVKYTEAGLAKAPASWSQVSDNTIIDELNNSPLAQDVNQSDAPVATFTPPTDSIKHAKAEGTKQLTLNFDFNSAILSDGNKVIIDREVSGIAQGFANARIRVEGNTDNVGKADYNKKLSERRAQSVVDYLISEYKFDHNKFIVVGNGSAKPVCEEANEPDCQAKNRRTDVNFLW